MADLAAQQAHLGADVDVRERHAPARACPCLRAHTPVQPWWLGFLDTGVASLPDAPKVAVYAGWGYALLEGGPDQCLSVRRNSARRTRAGSTPRLTVTLPRPTGQDLDDVTPWHSALPELMFPRDRSWLVSTMWDDAWRCIGGPAVLIDSLVERPELEVRAVTLDQDVTPPGHELD